MKTKGFLICLLLGIIYMACDDSIGRVGLGILPDEDKISIFDTTVVVGARTIEVDSVYAKTTSGFLGDFYDPSYGNIRSSFICQYYPSVGFPYLDSIVGNKIDSVRLLVYYSSYIGDSLAPMEVTVYPVIKALDEHFYTNVDPNDYCDMDNPLAKYSYTARNLNIPDDILQEYGNAYYISIPLPVKIGQDYLDKVKNDELKTVGEFLDFFPGTYLTTTFGTGSMLAVQEMDILVYYTRETTLKAENGNDSIANRASAAAFNVTKEIIQLNRFENKNPEFLLEDNPDKVFLKSPAGIFTELTIPIQEITKGIGKKKFSSVRLSLRAYHPDEWEYSLPFPGVSNYNSSSQNGVTSKLLLIEPDSVANFFQMRQVANAQTSYTTSFNSSTYSYDFNNISNIVQNAIEKAPDKDLKLWLIPVQTTWTAQQSYSGTAYVDYLTSHYLYPSGVTLKKGGDNLQVRVIATDLQINN